MSERPKLRIVIDDPETRAVWETAKRAKAEVASWPEWKGGPHRPSWGIARIVREAERGRVWHSVLWDRGVTIVTHCGTEMPRGCWLQTDDESIAPNCKRCEHKRATRPTTPEGRTPALEGKG